MSLDRPNFVLFITDQHRADYLGCAGHPILRTPHLDGIAAKGAMLDHFYVASPVCMPNRASLMTGRLPSVHGARANGMPLSTMNHTFVEVLAETGYATALVGKSHLQNFTGAGPSFLPPDPPPGLRRVDGLTRAVTHGLDAPGYDEENPLLWEAGKRAVEVPFYGFQHVDLVTGHGDQCGGAYLHWLRERLPDADRVRNPAAALPHDYLCPQAVRTAVPPALYPTSFIRERAVAYLESRVERASEEPFFLMVSFPDPHHPFTPPGQYWNQYAPSDMVGSAAFTRDDWAPSELVSRLSAQRAAGTANLVGQDPLVVSEREAREAQALTCGMIAMIDDVIGDVLAALDRTGQRDETVVIFMSDHGDYLGDHRLLLKGSAMYQGLIRTPFLWSDPAGPRAARISGLASTIDVAPTILARAGLAPLDGMQGMNLLPALAGDDPARDHVLIQYEHQRGSGVAGRMPRLHSLVTPTWRLTLAEGNPAGELYDLERDPEEFHNCWDEADVLPVQAKLLELLARAEMAAVDQLPLPTGRA